MSRYQSHGRLPFAGIGMALLVLLLAGCAGNNDVAYKETSPATTGKVFTELSFVQDDSTVAVPADLQATLQNDIQDYLQKTVGHLQELEKQGQALNAIQRITPRKLTVHYKVVRYDPGTPLLRRFLGEFGIGAAHLEVDSQFVDEHGTDVGATRIDEALAGEPQLLQSDTELLAAMFVSSTTQNIKKNYLYQPKEK